MEEKDTNLEMGTTQECTNHNKLKPADKEEAEVEPPMRENKNLEMGSNQECAGPNEQKHVAKEEAENLEMGSNQECTDPNKQKHVAKEEAENLEMGSNQERADPNEQKHVAKDEAENLEMGSNQECADPNEQKHVAKEEAEVRPLTRENKNLEIGSTQECADPNEQKPVAKEEDEDLEMGSTVETADPNEEKPAAKEEAKVESSTRENEALQLNNNQELAGPSVQRLVIDEEAMETERHRHENEEVRLEFFTRQSQSFQRLFAYETIANYTEDLMYGTPIQIQSKVNIFQRIVNPFMQISVLIIDLLHDIDFIKDWPDPLVTVSITKRCLRRNIFTCVSAAEKEPNTPVLYGDDFYIRVYYSLGPELYLTGNMHRMNDLGKIPICLTDTADQFAKFHIVDPDPSRRSDLLGTPVKNFKTVCIAQTFSSQLLTADMTEVTDLMRDHPVVCDTFNEDVLNITSENYFIFRTDGNHVLESDTDSDGQDNSGYSP